ncbi:MAG TPA: histidinol dehydrogenase [Candidatus Baltobacteraceae bacterium]|jgi:histidinol dehydrogenase|nr:histidinol dehydrogenase [Candidatus Baltobacteraceae bacterium]
MNVISHLDADFARQVRRLLAPSSLFDPAIEAQTRAIIESVQNRGDSALTELTERFNGVRLRPDQFALTQAEWMAASLQADESLRAAIAETTRNVENFAKRSRRKDWSMRNSHGALVGEKFDPFQRVGIYIPGGAAPLVSTALMTIPLARVAGCREIVVCTPCGRDGQVNPALVFAARDAGATEILRLGGAQAIAAMALGTETIRRVNKIFGPGNAYVVAAKRLLFGHAAMDLLPGPSELLVLADDSANPSFIAADLLAQAEHGSGHERVWLLTPSAKIARAAQKEIARQLPKMARSELIGRALARNGWVVRVADMGQGIGLANQIAPEHLEIMCRDAGRIATSLVTAGAIFLGNDSPTVLGDYVAGPSHTLPAGGSGVSFAGLTVDQFQRRTSIVEYKKPALRRALRTVAKFSEIEGLDAHGWSAALRLRR